MGTTGQNIQAVLTILQIVVGFAVLLVALGHRFGKLEARRENPMSTSPSLAVTNGSNGHQSVGELERNLERLRLEFTDDRRNYLPVGEANARFEANTREHEDIWGAIKDLRVMHSAAGRRIDALFREET